MEAKQQIVRELLADRTSLLEAAASFRRLDDHAQSRWVRAPQHFLDAASDDEAYCRSVLMFLQTTAPMELSEETAERLQVELNAMFPSKKPHATAAGSKS